MTIEEQNMQTESIIPLPVLMHVDERKQVFFNIMSLMLLHYDVSYSMQNVMDAINLVL